MVVVSFCLVVLALGQFTTWLSSVSATALGMLAGLAVAMRAYPYTGLSLERSVPLTLVALSATALAVIWRHRDSLRLPTRSGFGLAASALVVPVSALTAMVVIILRSGGTKISWAMGNDATFSLMIGRFIVEDGGDDPSKHLTSAPLTYEVLAAFMAPGRSSVDPRLLLTHDVDRVIQVLLLMLAAMSLLMALTVAQVVPRHRVVSRIVLSLVMGAVPWTWFVAGFGLKYGFNNALLTGVIVVAVWAAWIEGRSRPVLGTAVQAMAATALLATWAPLVLIPLGLGGVLLASSWRQHVRLRGFRLVAWIMPVALFAWYAIFATLPVFRESSGALANDGAIFASHPADAVTVLGLALAIVILATATRQSSWQAVGVVTIGVTGTVGALYLVAQRVDNPAGLWGYYPAKYAWLLAMFAPVVCARAIAERLGETSLSWARRGGLVAACSLVVLALMAQYSPPDLRSVSPQYKQPRPTPDWRLASVFPLVSIAADEGMSDFDPAVQTLMRLSDPDRKIFVVRYSGASIDTFINYWLLWQAFDKNPLMNGGLAFALTRSEDPVGEVCAVVRTWGSGVEIITRDKNLQRRVRAACPDVDVTITRAPSEASEVERGRV
ncbi:MAG: hypothetical protein ABWY58_05590 [Aeromicrobium sp.]